MPAEKMWITKDHRHIPVSGTGGRQPSVARRGSNSLAGIRGFKEPPYHDAERLIRYELPLQRAFTDEVKSAVIGEMRKRGWNDAADAAGPILDQVIARALPSAAWSVRGDVYAKLSTNGVRGSASFELAVDPLASAGVKLPDGAPAPELYVRGSLKYDGNLRTKRLSVTKVKVECGVRADLPGGQAGMSISSAPPRR